MHRMHLTQITLYMMEALDLNDDMKGNLLLLERKKISPALIVLYAYG
jgi:hypothetical protein